ncbi:hypothetical protein SMQE30_32530 [Serratia marcescens]|nr:hypothetical protein SMQE30_32530 [Serratia marcescens]
MSMKIIRFILLKSCFLFIQFPAFGEVDLNIKWIKKTETLQALSISPTGTVSAPLPSWGKMKCYMWGGNDFCMAYWELRIGNKYLERCPTTVTVNTGTTMSYMIAQINSKMMKSCTFPYYEFSGDESPCLRLGTYGYYADPQEGGVLALSFVTYGNCYSGGNDEGQGGG